MRFGFFAAIALVSSALALPTTLESRASDNAPAVITSIKQLQTDVVTLNKTLNTFKANQLLSVFTALQIQQQVTTLSNDLIAATKAANSSSPFTGDESGQIAVVVLNFSPQIQSLLANIVRKKPAFRSAFLLVGDLSATVEKDLKQQRKLTKQFSAAVTANLAEPFKSLAPTITGPINKYFTDAIKQYKACTGLICLPAIG